MKRLRLDRIIHIWCCYYECVKKGVMTARSTTPLLDEATITTEPPGPTIDLKREQMKIAFYREYDVMTGVRIAATLGGFFGLMVILVVYKSKSKTEKALENPTIAAAAVAEAEEEERQIAAALEATAYQQLNPRRSRRSLDTTSIPPGWIRNTTRFSSVGGYSSLLEPPTRTHSRLPSFVDEDSPPEEEYRSAYDDVSSYDRYLNVPRRSSNITCSSSESSYLERRGSAVILGLPALPAHKSRGHGHRRPSSPLPENYDFYYPIDIRVIQPTPGGSPCGSERALYDNVPTTTLTPRLAPLASISSCNSSLAADYPDLEGHSFISDSVFRDDCEDTDDEIDPFSTDSDMTNDDRGACCGGIRRDTQNRKRSSSESQTTTPRNERPPFPLPVSMKASSTSLQSSDSNGSIKTPQYDMKDCLCNQASSSNFEAKASSWTQETLF